MGKRRKKSGSVTHKRAILTTARPPKGRKWRKVEDIMEGLVAEHGPKAYSMEIMHVLGGMTVDNGWRGNAATEYVWEYYLKHGYSLTLEGAVEHIDGTEFGLWLDRMHDNTGWKVESVEKPEINVVDTEAARAKVIGDKFRAETAAMSMRADKSAQDIYTNRDIRDIWQRISKGEFPLGIPAFTAEMARLAKLRANK